MENDEIHGDDNVGKGSKHQAPLSTDGLDVDNFWVFGYGSLVWKVDFATECSRTGYIEGYLRRFYQHSIDHRGTVQKPGRVVTLIPSDDAADDNTARKNRVLGVAYKIPADKVAEVIHHLDYREKNGYERHNVHFHTFPPSNAAAEPMNVCIYVATPTNASFAGPAASMHELAAQIHEAHGPSGRNTEYVFNLADAMRKLFPGEIDDHLYELESLLRKMSTERN